MPKMKESKQVNTKQTKLVRIDAGLHKELKILGARTGKSIRDLVEQNLTDLLGPRPAVQAH
jgi:predicted HicB family RNase H-like nuclease